MGRQYFQDLIGNITVDGTAVANTTTETAVHPANVLPAHYMQDGRLLRIRAFGKLSVTGTPTIIFALRWGGATSGVLLATTEAITNGSGLTNVNWSIEIYVQCRGNGATGSLMVMGEATVQTNASGDPTTKSNVFGVSGSDAPAAVTVNLIQDTDLALTAKWSAASASNTLQCLLFSCEALN